MKTKKQIIIIVTVFLCMLAIGGTVAHKRYTHNLPVTISLRINDPTIAKSQIEITTDNLNRLMLIQIMDPRYLNITTSPDERTFNIRLENDSTQKNTESYRITKTTEKTSYLGSERTKKEKCTTHYWRIFERISTTNTIFNGKIGNSVPTEIYLNDTLLWKSKTN